MAELPVLQGSLSTYLTEIHRLPLLTPEEEHDLAVHYHETGDVETAHKLVTANLRFVVKIAYEYNSYGLRMSDLIQEGNIGLMMAVKKFDPYKGYRLISYAVWWIRATIQSFILKSWSLVKIGTTQAQRKLFYKLGQTKRTLARFFTEGESLEHLSSGHQHLLAETLKVRDADVAEMDQRMRSRDVSLDQPLNDETQTTPLDLLTSMENQEDLLSQSEEQGVVQAEVHKAVETLNEKEKFIVQNRLMTDEPLTLQEIGNHYKISRERARQLEERAKQKIRLILSETTLAREAI